MLVVGQKAVRARVIKWYMDAAGYPEGCVCFSCGNAAAALRAAGVRVLEVGPHGALRPGHWWEPEEVHRAWPHLFDATSGHLPLPLMARIAEALRTELQEIGEGPHDIPTGSGETIVCLRMAYPNVRFRPTSLGTPETLWDPQGPLYGVVHGPAGYPTG